MLHNDYYMRSDILLFSNYSLKLHEWLQRDNMNANRFLNEVMPELKALYDEERDNAELIVFAGP